MTTYFLYDCLLINFYNNRNKLESNCFFIFILIKRIKNLPFKKNTRILNSMTKVLLILFRSQSYKTLISSFFRFSLLRLSVCRTGKYCHIKMNTLKWPSIIAKNGKNLRFIKKKVW